MNYSDEEMSENIRDLFSRPPPQAWAISRYI
jgi:hypothetical protein